MGVGGWVKKQTRRARRAAARAADAVADTVSDAGGAVKDTVSDAERQAKSAAKAAAKAAAKVSRKMANTAADAGEAVASNVKATVTNPEAALRAVGKAAKTAANKALPVSVDGLRGAYENLKEGDFRNLAPDLLQDEIRAKTGLDARGLYGELKDGDFRNAAGNLVGGQLDRYASTGSVAGDALQNAALTDKQQRYLTAGRLGLAGGIEASAAPGLLSQAPAGSASSPAFAGMATSGNAAPAVTTTTTAGAGGAALPGAAVTATPVITGAAGAGGLSSMLPASLAVAGAGTLASGALGYMASRQQAQAAQDALEQQQQMSEDAIARNNQMLYGSGGALSTLEGGNMRAREDLNSAFGDSRDVMQRYTQAGLDTFRGTAQKARDALTTGNAQAGNLLGQGYDTATGRIDDGVSSALDRIGGRQDRLGSAIDAPGGLYGNFQGDPGYQFRLKQGEDAINRMNAAKGGRYGGAALKALSAFNQDLASQEFDKFAGRQNQLAGILGQSDTQAYQATGDAANLLNNRGNLQAQMAQQRGRDLSGLATGLSGALADNYGNLGSTVGQASIGYGSNLANQRTALGGNLANTAIGTANSKVNAMTGNQAQNVGLQQAYMQALNNPVQYAGGATGELAQTAANLTNQVPVWLDQLEEED